GGPVIVDHIESGGGRTVDAQRDWSSTAEMQGDGLISPVETRRRRPRELGPRVGRRDVRAGRPQTGGIRPRDLFNFASRPAGRFCSTVARPPALGGNDEPLFPIWIGPAREPLRSLADVLLIL